jgi:hypothetical protein
MGKGERKYGAAPAADVNENNRGIDREYKYRYIHTTYYIEKDERKKEKTYIDR